MLHPANGSFRVIDHLIFADNKEGGGTDTLELAVVKNIGEDAFPWIGIPEMLDKEFLFKAGDSESLKNKMQWIVDNYKDIKVAFRQTDNAKYLSSKRYIDKILSL